MIGDEKAIKQAFSLKGASGNLCCGCCKNVTSLRSDLARHDAESYLVSTACVDVSRFDVHSDESFFEFVDYVRDQSAVLGVGAFEDLLKQVGMSWEPEGLVFDRSIRSRVPFISTVYYDWMHCLLQGGVAAIEVSMFLRKTLQCHPELTMDDINDFIEAWHVPAQWRRLPKRFLKESRFSKSPAYLKCYNSELLVFLLILRRFVEMVLCPLDHEEMKPCIASFCAVCDLVQAFNRQRSADELFEAVQTHHRLNLAAWGLAGVTVKWHLLYHIVPPG